MAWPKKNTRKITVNGIEFLWHLSKNSIDSKETLITAGSQHDRFFLFIDPYPWEFEIKPAHISAAVEWASKQGWNPETGPSKYLAFSAKAQKFVWLPDGIKHLHQIE